MNKEGLKINYNELLNVIEYLKIVIYIAHRQDELKEEFIFDKNNEIHRFVEFLVGILEKKYAIVLSNKSIEEILKVIQKNIKREIGSISSFTNYLKEDIEEFIKQIDEKYVNGVYVKADRNEQVELKHQYVNMTVPR